MESCYVCSTSIEDLDPELGAIVCEGCLNFFKRQVRLRVTVFVTSSVCTGLGSCHDDLPRLAKCDLCRFHKCGEAGLIFTDFLDVVDSDEEEVASEESEGEDTSGDSSVIDVTDSEIDGEEEEDTTPSSHPQAMEIETDPAFATARENNVLKTYLGRATTRAKYSSKIRSEDNMNSFICSNISYEEESSNLVPPVACPAALVTVMDQIVTSHTATATALLGKTAFFNPKKNPNVVSLMTRFDKEMCSAGLVRNLQRNTGARAALISWLSNRINVTAETFNNNMLKLLPMSSEEEMEEEIEEDD